MKFCSLLYITVTNLKDLRLFSPLNFQLYYNIPDNIYTTIRNLERRSRGREYDHRQKQQGRDPQRGLHLQKRA